MKNLSLQKYQYRKNNETGKLIDAPVETAGVPARYFQSVHSLEDWLVGWLGFMAYQPL